MKNQKLLSMNRFFYTSFAIVLFLLLGCKTEKHKFPLEKRFWDTNDYKSVTLELNYGYEDDEKLPSFDDPSTRMIVEKLTDHENYAIVLEDEELGVKHRSGVAEEFFQQWKDMQDIYRARDRQDKYLYDKEMLAVWQFGLGLQLRYFKLGNDDILASSDDPNSDMTKTRVNRNIKTLISNFNIYLDEINNENAFSNEGKNLLVEGIDKHFTALVELYPNADFGQLERKVNLMLEKSDSESIKESLRKLKELIESKKSVIET